MFVKQGAVSLVTLMHKGQRRVFLGDLDITNSLTGYQIRAESTDVLRATLELIITDDPDEQTKLSIAEKLLRE